MEEKCKLPIVTELTPELAEKIWDSVQMKMLGDRLSKEAVLHHLKQLKAEMGKLRKNNKYCDERYAISACMEMIDKKIGKINAN